MNLKSVSQELENSLSGLFDELMSGIAEREDSRAFGAMVERRITDNWTAICENLGYGPLERPGRRTIYDFAFQMGSNIVGIDVKTKDLDSTSYSDGGIWLLEICSSSWPTIMGSFLLPSLAITALPTGATLEILST
jgi:hypothetical protein